MIDESAPKCKKLDCLIARTGKCAEGHEPVHSCPNFDGMIEEDDDFDEEDAADPNNRNIASLASIQLPPGDLLSVADVEHFLLGRAATFVSVIGDSNSGKTTLMCALYDRFLRGPFAGVSFAASRTLVALEQRIHPSRVESGRNIPDTPRSSIADGLRYFHFAVAPIGSPRSRVDLMLSDRAGETYRAARNNTDRIADLAEIPQANILVLLLDGGRVANAVERAGAIHGTRQMLRVLLDNEALGPTSTVQIVTTKIDRIAEGEDPQNAMEAVAAFRERAATDFGSKLGRLSFHDTAARDPDGTFDPAHGLDTLLVDWITPAAETAYVRPARPELKSEFDRLLLRTRAEDGL